MRNCLLFAFLGLALQAQAQLYVPMPTSNAKWNQSYMTWHHEDITLVQTAEDTTHNSLTYTTLYQQDAGYQGAMREDNRVVYFLPAGDTTEVVLYDFNVQAGDTVSHWWMQRAIPWYNPQYPDTLIVDYVDSILVGANYRQQITIKVQDYNYTRVIAGIGNMSGLLRAWSNGAAEYNIELTCFRVNDTAIWSAHSSAANYYYCADTTIVGVEKNIASNFRLYPNPTASEVFFEDLEMEYKVLIYNNLGQKVGETKISPYQNKIPMQELNAGIYYLHFVGGDGRKSLEKIVKY